MPTLIHERVRLARAGKNPTVICAMPSGWAVLGDAQFLPGYCLLLPDPVMPDLNALSLAERARYLRDMTLIGDALLETTDAFRVNYETLGNSDPALHTHIFPRYQTEPDEFRARPAFSYGREHRASRSFDLNRDKPLMDTLADAIRRLLSKEAAEALAEQDIGSP